MQQWKIADCYIAIWVWSIYCKYSNGVCTFLPYSFQLPANARRGNSTEVCHNSSLYVYFRIPTLNTHDYIWLEKSEELHMLYIQITSPILLLHAGRGSSDQRPVNTTNCCVPGKSVSSQATNWQKGLQSMHDLLVAGQVFLVDRASVASLNLPEEFWRENNVPLTSQLVQQLEKDLQW